MDVAPLQHALMDTATLSIALFGAVVATLSLGWQVAAWVLEGRRVRVTLRHGLMAHGRSATGAVGRDCKPQDLGILRAQGMDGPEVVAITVTNLGRSPVTISKYSVFLTKGGLSLNLFSEDRAPVSRTDFHLAKARPGMHLWMMCRRCSQPRTRSVHTMFAG